MHCTKFSPLGLLLIIHSLGRQAFAQVNLGTALPFGIIANQAITNTGPTVVDGRLGIYPNGATSITGFPPGLSGQVNAGDAVANIAQQDAQTAYNTAASLAPTALIGQELGGQTLVAGTYKASSSVDITGTLVLDGQNDPNAQFVFQIGSTLTTAPGSSVVLINGAQACNVFWQVGSSATLDTTTVFSGNILAQTSISLNSGVTVSGGLFALTGAVTLINDQVTAQQNCVAQSSTLSSSPATATVTVTSTTTASAVVITVTTTSVQTSPVSVVTVTSVQTVPVSVVTATITITLTVTSPATSMTSTPTATVTSTTQGVSTTSTILSTSTSFSRPTRSTSYRTRSTFTYKPSRTSSYIYPTPYPPYPPYPKPYPYPGNFYPKPWVPPYKPEKPAPKPGNDYHKPENFSPKPENFSPKPDHFSPKPGGPSEEHGSSSYGHGSPSGEHGSPSSEHGSSHEHGSSSHGHGKAVRKS